MQWPPLLLALACGCGRISFDSIDGPPGAPIAIDAPPALVDAPRFSFDGGGCPSGYQVSAGNCHRNSATNGNWLAAELACEADAVGAHLLVIDSEAERAAVAPGISGDTWIGTSRRTVPGFRTVVDTPGYLDWGTPQSEPTELCVGFGSDGLMYTRACTDNARYICEYDGIPAAASTY